MQHETAAPWETDQEGALALGDEVLRPHPRVHVIKHPHLHIVRWNKAPNLPNARVISSSAADTAGMNGCTRRDEDRDATQRSRMGPRNG
eukprot:59772-Rhodomonas_salina.1